MKKFGVFSFILAVVLFITACGSTGGGSTSGTSNSSGDSQKAESGNLLFATNTQGSAWYIYGATMAELLRPVMSGRTVDVLPFAGGIGNAKMLDEKKADVSFSFSITSKWAYEGNVAYQKKQENLRGLVGALDQYYIGIVASKAFVDKHGIKTVKDIVDKKAPVRIYTNNKGSLAEFSTSQVLEAYGVNYDTIKQYGGKVELTSNDVIQSSFQNGEADLHILVMPKGHPTISELSIHTPIVFLPMEDNIINKFKGFGYTDVIFPKGLYKGQDYDVQTVGFSTMILTTSDLSEDAAYNIAKTVIENKEKLDAAHDALKDFNPENAMKPESLNVPLHPGAEKYYKEKGLLK